jgi:protein required for attachment to host cells
MSGGVSVDLDHLSAAARDASSNGKPRRCGATGAIEVSMKQLRTWILVCDGGRSQVYSGSGSGLKLEPVAGSDCVNDLPDPRDNSDNERDTGYSSSGNRRYGVEDRVDPRREMEARFLAAQLNWVAERHASFDRVVIVAPPRALGVMRKSIPPVLKGKIAGEIAADLTRATAPDIAARVSADLAS